MTRFDVQSTEFVDAACTRDGVDPDLFFPTNEFQFREARTHCATCPARQACFELREELPKTAQDGVWHGELFLSGEVRDRVPRPGRARLTPDRVAS